MYLHISEHSVWFTKVELFVVREKKNNDIAKGILFCDIELTAAVATAIINRQ